MTPEEFMAGAEVTPLGDAWGEPLWRVHNDAANQCIDVHALDEAGARTAAESAFAEYLARPT